MLLLPQRLLSLFLNVYTYIHLFLFYFSPSSWSWSPLAGLYVSATTFIFHIHPLVILATAYNSLPLIRLLYFGALISISITITTHNLKLMVHAFFSSFYILLQVLNRMTNGEMGYNFISRLTGETMWFPILSQWEKVFMAWEGTYWNVV